MHPDHHNKIIGISAAIIIVIVFILGLTIVIYNRQQNEPAPVPSEQDLYNAMVESMTAKESSSIDDPEVQELNEITTSSGGGSGDDREALIQATSQIN